jgi:hypothetical protein
MNRYSRWRTKWLLPSLLALALSPAAAQTVDEKISPPPAPSSAVAAPTPRPKPVFRLYSDTSAGLTGGATSNNLALIEYDGFALGAERTDDAKSKSFGVILPLRKVFHMPVNLYLTRTRTVGGAEHELTVQARPSKNQDIDLVARVLDLQGRSGLALSFSYREPGIFDEKSRMGAGVEFVRLGTERSPGGYAWVKPAVLKNHYLGASVSLEDSRIVIGKPMKEGFAWRYFRLDEKSGFQLDEFLFSTKGVNLSTIDFESALRGPGNNLTSSYLPGYVFRYVLPPVSARGRGFTAGLLHTKTPDGVDTLNAEAVQYIGNRFFVGGGYNARTDAFGRGSVLFPIGVRYGRDDGMTRNYFRIAPTHDLRTGKLGLVVNLELRL